MGFNLRGAFSQKFPTPLAAKLYVGYEKERYKNGMDLLYHLGEYDGARNLHAAEEGCETVRCLFWFIVCPSCL